MTCPKCGSNMTTYSIPALCGKCFTVLPGQGAIPTLTPEQARAKYPNLGLEDPEARSAETKAAGLVKGETACNRSACQAPLEMGKRWWNTGTNAWYCMKCARRINECETICFLEGTANAKVPG